MLFISYSIVKPLHKRYNPTFQNACEHKGRIMSVELHFNRQQSSVAPGLSLFDYADALGIRVPTSCRKQGKCKECLVEVVAGMECLSAKSPEEKHLKENFRLSCRCRIVADSGVVRCHTMRRGEMRIERNALQLP